MFLSRHSLAALVTLVIFFVYSRSLSISVIVSFVIYLISGGWRFIRILYKTLPRDIRSLTLLLWVKMQMKRMDAKRIGIPQLFDLTAKRLPNKPCFLFEDQVWTFSQVEKYSNKIANYLLATGHKPGDVVALYAESRPQFVCVWLGMAKVGIVTALINFNLKSQSLIHCVEAANARSFIFGVELTDSVLEAQSGLSAYQLFSLGGPSLAGVTDLDAELQTTSSIRPPLLQSPRLRDRLFYIYTSGTTGLPKAAIITHARFYFMAGVIGCMNWLTENDVLYDCLPLYHTAGGVLGIGQAILYGTTVVIKRKFSASRFWPDCVQFKCTAAQYIGELCRYLLAQPEKPADQLHNVRVMFGNGLRPQIWEQFQNRFKVARIGEFYGATESNANLVNPDNTVGACGFLTQIAPFLYPVSLIRIEEDSGEPVRGPTGLCVAAGPNEVGELVGAIVKGDMVREVDGYVEAKATEKKILRNVFKHGDAHFMTGDMLFMDDLGYVYFKDRTGDTFRWKGENVSTSEVEASISNILQLTDCTVYGVEIPNTEGRAGMAAIADPEGKGVSVDLLSASLPRLLPPYARPQFLRIVRNIEATGTFKMKKTELRKEGYDPSKCGRDLVYYMESRTGHFCPVTSEVFQNIQRGVVRF